MRNTININTNKQQFAFENVGRQLFLPEIIFICGRMRMSSGLRTAIAGDGVV
jgi:hypothetical protein